MITNPDDRDIPIEEPAQPPSKIFGWRYWHWIIVLMVVVTAANSKRIGRWWEHRQKQIAYVDLMTLEKGDIQLRDSGGYFEEGKFHLRVVLDNELPSNGMGGIDDAEFVVNWNVAIVVNGQEIHSVKWTGSPNPRFLFGSCSTPRYETVQEYLANGAEVRVSLTQQGRNILLATQKLTEKREEKLDFPNANGSKIMVLLFKDPAELSFHRGEQLLLDGKIEAAIEELSSSISACPFQPEAFRARAQAFLEKQEMHLAKSDFLEAVRLSKADFDTSKEFAQLLKKEDDFMEARLVSTLDNETLLAFYNNMAYEYATCPTDSHRHGSKSLSLAKQICEATEHKNAKYLTTLAVAHAECGEFEQAANVVNRAQELLVEKTASNHKSQLQQMLKSFEAKRPIRRYSSTGFSPLIGRPDVRSFGTTPSGGVVDSGRMPVEPSGTPVTDDIKLSVGDFIQVKWMENWWNGEVIGLLRDGNVKVHYIGWSSEWDEVVSRERLRIESPRSKNGKQ